MTSGTGPGHAAPRGLEAELAAGLDDLKRRGLLRSLEPAGQTPELSDFLSNDFLGLARHPEVAAAAAAAALEHGAGGRASRLLGGGSPLHARAEESAARWLGCEAGLLFPSGYQANLGVLQALAGRGDAILSDALNHASLVDAARLSRARVAVYRHLDLEHLDALLAGQRAARRRLVVTESIFSMDGDLAPLAALHDLCERRDAWLIVDEAHAAGLLGQEGAGAWAALERPDEEARRLACRIVTAGKALGVAGAFVAGSAVLCRHVVNVARTFMYTTAPPPAVPGALLSSIEIARGADEARRAVLERAHRLAAAFGLPAPAAAILPYVLGDAERALQAAARCRAQGLDVMAVRPPTVPQGTSRLRIAVHAYNGEAECQRLIEALAPFPRAAPPPAASAPQRASCLFVVGTDTGIGKTVVSALFLRAARGRGPARYWKPVQTGSEDDTETVRLLAEAAPEELL
ncbi:MAG: aminotransferase class I/II-fold pyridoxal phosphate-dependent enzyme, partial [Planctomycetes bacterium]|nr:aminotransferase class I/II-fold pyridoxal phosphate-dependent enzyme [Planctomycetota bacterium]